MELTHRLQHWTKSKANKTLKWLPADSEKTFLERLKGGFFIIFLHILGQNSTNQTFLCKIWTNTGLFWFDTTSKHSGIYIKMLLFSHYLGFII